MKGVMNKRGQGMSTSTIILLVLGLIVLVILSVGFMSGWNAFKAESGKTNVDNIVEECATTCSLNQKFSFCSAEKELIFAEEEFKIKTSCAVLANEPGLKAKYGVQECPTTQCQKLCVEILIDSKKGRLVTTIPETLPYDVTVLASDADGVNSFCIID